MEQTDKPRVYFLHGLLGTAYAHFSEQIQRWGDRYELVPVDLPGHGKCRLDAADDYLDQALDYVVALLEKFGAGRLVAASHLGAPVAVRCAEARPDLVESLVLTGFAPDAEREPFLRMLAGFQLLGEDRADLAEEYDRLHGPRWRRTIAAFAGHTERAFAELVRVDAARLGALGVPVALVNGTFKSAEQSAAERASGFGPLVTGRVIDGAGHIASHDAPEEFCVAAEEFWTTVALRALLQETDVRRPLDSLETVVVRTHLTSAGLAPGEPPNPNTIEGWGAWAVRRSPVS
ncbi:alpha/beta hydrolase [Actinokineospora soli]